MSDDTRLALSIPRIVPTNLGPVAVGQLSATKLLVSIEKIIALGIKARGIMDSAKGLGFMEAALIVLRTYPAEVLAVLEGATDLEPGKMGEVELDGLMGILIAFVELHEVALTRFFELRALVERVMGRTGIRPSPNSSITSLPAAGPSQTSNGSPSSSLSSTPDSPPSEESKIASGS